MAIESESQQGILDCAFWDAGLLHDDMQALTKRTDWLKIEQIP
jgi:hypothetical protein